MITPIRRRTPTALLKIINELHLQEIVLNTFYKLRLAENLAWLNKLKQNKKTLKFTLHLLYWKTEAKEALGHVDDDETTLKHINSKQYPISI